MNRTHSALATLLTIGSLSISSLPALAQAVAAPSVINFQGRLATPSGNPVPDGIYSIRFSLWDAVSAGTEKWNQTVASVAVKNGTFAVPLSGFSATTFDGNGWLEIKIGTDAPLAPRTPLVSVPYALKSNLALTVPDGSITANKLANGAFNGLSWLLGGNSGTTASHFLGTIGNQPLVFKTNNAERMRIAANGSVGIGTNNPGRLLQVGNTDVSSVGIIRVAHYDGDSNFRSWDFGTGDEFLFGHTDNFGFKDNSGNTIMVMQSSGQGGNVGIGTNNPQRLLHLNGTADAGMRLSSGQAQSRTSFVEFANGGNVLWQMGKEPNNDFYLDRPNVARILTIKPDTLRVGIGTSLPQATLDVAGTARTRVLEITGGSDVAEPYTVAPVDGVKPVAGMLVVIDPDKIGKMRVASHAYDSTVAGIISGANGIHPGITLRQTGTVADGELPVASIGRVWCWCDADANGAIKAGDMLTTSDTPGHAMKVSDHARANGSVIGKAMSSLKSGKGLVLVLVSLK